MSCRADGRHRSRRAARTASIASVRCRCAPRHLPPNRCGRPDAMAASSIAAALGRVSRLDGARALFPGVLACGVVAAASTFLSQHYGAPVMLFALLLGMAMNFLSADGACAPGIAFTARTLLRVGVALLGLRITAAQVAALGWEPLLLVALSVALTIGLSMLVARAMGFQPLFGLLTGGATA